MTSPIPQTAAEQGASPNAPAAEVAASSTPPGSTSPLTEPALTVTVVPGWVSEIADEQAAEVEAGCPVSVAIERAVVQALLTAAAVAHRAHDWAADTRGRPPSPERERWEQRVWHTEYEGGSVSATAWKDTRGRPAVNVMLFGPISVSPEVAERLAGDLLAAAADARARFGTATDEMRGAL